MSATRRKRQARADTSTSAPRTPPRGGRIGPSSAVVSTPRGSGTLLINVSAGRRIELDMFGARVWSELEREPTLATLVARLYDDGASAVRLAEDVMRLIARLRIMGIVRWR